MKLVIQRVKSAHVQVKNETVGEIQKGLLMYLGVSKEDTEEDLKYLVEKTIHLRIFDDEQGVMNRSLLDVSGSILLVSQFTLLADTRKGRRPGYHLAASPEMARSIYEKMTENFRCRGIHVQNGQFQTNMEVYSCNDGPVTILIDSKNK